MILIDQKRTELIFNTIVFENIDGNNPFDKK